MNILIVYSTPFPTIRGGVDNVVVTLSNELKKNKEKPVVFSHADWEHKGTTRASRNGISVYTKHIRMPLPGRKPIRNMIAGLFHMHRELHEIKNIIQAESIDVIHLHTLQLYHLYFCLISRLGGPPCVVTLHRAEVLAYPNRSSLDRFLWRWILRTAKHVNAVSEWLAEEAEREFPFLEHVNVIENGIDTNPEIPNETELASAINGNLPSRFFIAVGVLEDYKGHDVLIESAKHFCAHYADVDILIAGSGSRRSSYEERIRVLGLERRVRLLGSLPHSVVQGLMKMSLAVVMPSRNEGFGLVVTEAGAVAAPVIGSNIGPFRRMIEDGTSGLLVPAGDEAALANAMNRICSDSGLRDRLGKALAQTVKERFSASVMTESYISLYRNATRQ